jgi:hypothetical protein
MSTVIALLNQVKNDKIVLPGIQRDFVWDKDRIVKLLDSILRGYPVGIALLWETYNDIQFRPFVREYVRDTVPKYAENQDHKQLKLVLDGQQRLQSLYIALYGSYEARQLYFDVLSGRDNDDLRDERYLFEFLKPIDAETRNTGSSTKSYWLRVSELFGWGSSERQVFRRQLVTSRSLSDDDYLRLETNLGRFDDALMRDENVLRVSTIDEDLPVGHPSRKTEADVLEIFVRINAEGTPLSKSDLIFSMLKLNWKESAEQLPEFLAKVNTGNSFDLNTDFVVRCLFAVSEIGAKLDLDLLRRQSNVAKLQENFDRCCTAIEAAVDFVITECRCQNSALIGGQNTLVPFVYYFFHLPHHQLPNNGVTAARKVLYLFALARPFSRYGESRIANYIRGTLKPAFDEGELRVSVPRAIELIRYWERITSMDELLQTNEQLSLHLLQGLSGAKAQYAGNRPEVDHIFPAAELRKKGYQEDEINNVANYWILVQGKNRNKSDSAPRIYFQDVDDQVLERAAIDRDLLTSYKGYRRFLRERMATMVERVRKRIDLTEIEMGLLEAAGLGDLDEE